MIRSSQDRESDGRLVRSARGILRRVLLIIVLLVAFLAWWSFGSKDERSGTRSDASHDAARQASGSPMGANLEEGPSPRAPRPPLLKNVRHAGSVVTTSKVHAVIPEGDSMVTGGHLKADGSREFIVIKPVLVDNGGTQFLISTSIFKMTAAGLESTGLKSLVTNEEKNEQHAEVWTSEAVEALLRTREGMQMVSRPSVFLKPGATGTIRSGVKVSPGGGFNVQPDIAPSDEVNFTSMTIEANEAPNGGIELKLEITSGR